MLLINSLVYVFILLLFGRRALGRRPGVFYLIVAGFTAYILIAHFFARDAWWPGWFWSYAVFPVTRGSLSAALFVLVMYPGVLGDRFPGVKILRGRRGELAVVGCLLALGHAVYYGAYVFPALLARIGGGPSLAAASAVLAAILFIIMLPLMFTSFTAVRRRMAPRTWKTLQSAAYAFYLLLYLHVVIVFAAVLSGGRAGRFGETAFSLAVYSAVFLPYFVLLFRKYRRN
jgi:DMSO/TMAO reductase YedYZ heme-binding membrane subunit